MKKGKRVVNKTIIVEKRVVSERLVGFINTNQNGEREKKNKLKKTIPLSQIHEREVEKRETRTPKPTKIKLEPCPT